MMMLPQSSIRLPHLTSTKTKSVRASALKHRLNDGYQRDRAGARNSPEEGTHVLSELFQKNRLPSDWLIGGRPYR